MLGAGGREGVTGENGEMLFKWCEERIQFFFLNG